MKDLLINFNDKFSWAHDLGVVYGFSYAVESLEELQEFVANDEKYGATKFPVWAMPHQVHKTEVVWIQSSTDLLQRQVADGLLTCERGVMLAVQTADCLPLLLFDKSGKWVAAVHAGWRGLSAGILQNTIKKLVAFGVSTHDICLLIGPAITPDVYEVGEEVIIQFQDPCLRLSYQQWLSSGRMVPRSGKYLLDLPQIARDIFLNLGGDSDLVLNLNKSTFHDKKLASYRRDGQHARRNISFIGLC